MGSAVEDSEGRSGSMLEGGWLVGAAIGEGATAVVHRVEHPDRGVAAAKILRRECMARDEVRERFLREHEHLARISHPNVVTGLGSTRTEDGLPVVLMEMLEGSTLSALGRSERLSMTRIVEIASSVLQALAACHDQSVIHRDVKPGNVFLTDAGRLKLIDFGSARVCGRGETHRRLAIGTPVYMAPEQARGDEASATTDVFGVGALIYAALTRSAPRTDDDLRRIGREGVIPLVIAAPSVPTVLATVVDRAMAWDGNARWPSVRAFHDALTSIPRGALLIERPALLQQMTRASTPSAIRARESRPTMPDPIFVRRPKTDAPTE